VRIFHPLLPAGLSRRYQTSVISRYFSICKDGKEDVHNVVGEVPAIIRGPRGVVKEYVRQQRLCHKRSLLRRIATRVLQRMREARDETGIAHRFPGKVGTFLLASQEYRLRGKSAAVRLNPFPARAVQGCDAKCQAC
jgi:hypothetical protein